MRRGTIRGRPLLVAGCLAVLVACAGVASPPSFDDVALARGVAEEAPLTWPEPVTAMVVFSRFPDSRNRFEAEVYCSPRHDVSWLRLDLAHSDDVRIRGELPRFEGPLAAGEVKRWRIQGIFQGGDDIPPGLSLDVQYAFPYEAVAAEVHGLRMGFDRPDGELREFLVRLADQKGARGRILKTLALYPGAAEAGPPR